TTKRSTGHSGGAARPATHRQAIDAAGTAATRTTQKATTANPSTTPEPRRTQTVPSRPMTAIVSHRAPGGVPRYVDPVHPSVLHVSQPTVGGVPRCVVDLATHQVDRGWRVSVACPATGDLPGWVK